MEGLGSGKGLQPGWWWLRGVGLVVSPSVQKIFSVPTALGQECTPLTLLREGDYWSELQSMLNLANCWSEGARRGQVRSRGPA